MSDYVVDYRLGNAEEQHAAHPRSFFIPSREERESLGSGDMAQLLFELVDPSDDGPTAERMWVGVSGRTAEGYVGVLTNQPGAITTIRQGDEVGFGPEHVVSTLDDWPLLGKKAFVSLRSQEGDLRPGFVYREDPDHETDSGWRVMVGDETAEEVDDPANLLLQPLGYLLDRWPELRPVLETDPTNGAWVWHATSGRYEPEEA